MVARDEDALVFMDEAAHAGDEDLADVRVRFDTIGMMVLSENKALLRHHINCLGADFAG